MCSLELETSIILNLTLIKNKLSDVSSNEKLWYLYIPKYSPTFSPVVCVKPSGELYIKICVDFFFESI